MFDITSDDISQLNDSDLRELVGRLCEAELTHRGYSAAAVTWGGHQTAPDGGFDVRVALPPHEPIEGFIPRPSSGFQVKTPDMPRAAILAEMRPKDVIRPVIQELANEAGAYIIVSSRGSTTDSALGNRRSAMREALSDVPGADQLYTDFYDRTRLATWVRQHPGLITWVKEKIGRALVGWRPYGSWSGGTEEANAEYLLDDKLRLHLGTNHDSPTQSVAQAIDQLRDELAQPAKIVRLVGLSGVGKTRLVQALFDDRIGSRPLSPSLAIYTNLSDNPDPQPTGLASDLLTNRTRAVLIVDNCPPDLHRRLSELCSAPTSTVSVLTVEYDVRDDQPENTHVVTLDTSSPELIERLIRHRYPHISQVDARTIAEASGGNARIAIALAQTIERSGTIAGLSNDELFQRLFQQRHDPSNALLLAAQACSLVYSFQGEAIVGQEAELPRLAALADQSVAEIYRHIGELLRRDLAQQRGVWRAVLPHAIANRLAARALEDTPFDLIDQQLISGGTERLARSFSRRLSFLHDHPKAVLIVEKWLAPDGLLGDVSALSSLGRAMFENVAPVSPEVALTALERAGNDHPEQAPIIWRQHLSLLRSLAYDAPLFVRSAQLMARATTPNTDKQGLKQLSDTFASLFTLYLSGTHATIEQRLVVIEGLLRSSEAHTRTLALTALDQILEVMHFRSSHRFDFGARSRDHGYRPQTRADVIRWYGTAIAFVERLALDECMMKPELRDLIAKHLRSLWSFAGMYEELGRLSLRFAADGFWHEGWAACRQVMRYDRSKLPSEAASRLSALETALRPSNLQEQVRAVVLGDKSGRPNLEIVDIEGNVASASERLRSMARELGAAVATNDDVFTDLLSELLCGGNQIWDFGRGLASASPDCRATWTRLVEGLERLPLEQRNVGVFMGFLAELWEKHRDLANQLLDSALDQPALVVFLPVLHSAIELDEYGVERLKQTLSAGQVPIHMYSNLRVGRTTNDLSGEALKELLLLIADQPDGFDVAVDILSMRLDADNSAQREHGQEILEAGRQLLRRATFQGNNQGRDYELAGIVKACLSGTDAGSIVVELTARLKQAVVAYETYSFHNEQLLRALLELQPVIALDTLFTNDENDQWLGFDIFRSLGENGNNPADVISCEDLIAWCESDGERHYPLAASIITFARQPDASGSLDWSEQARALLSHAPDPRAILPVLIERFRPMSWSGSRAAVMEANAQLLDNLEPLVPPAIMPFVAEAKAQFAQEVARERQQETEQDRERDERFE